METLLLDGEIMDKYVVRDLKTGKDLGVFDNKNDANSFGRQLQRQKESKYRVVVDLVRLDGEGRERRSRRYLNAAFDYTAVSSNSLSSGSFVAPTGGSLSDGTSPISPSPSPAPSTGTGTSGPVTYTPPTTESPILAETEIVVKAQPAAQATEDSASAAIATTNESMAESSSDFDNRILLGAGAVIGGAGLLYDLNRDEESLVRRAFSRNKNEARKVFKEEFEIVASSTAKDDLKTLLEIDFSRRGPLYQAFQKDKLALNPERSGWVIEKGGIFLPYTAKNFGKDRGFSAIQTKAESYVYSENGLILPREMFRQRVQNGQYTDFQSIDPSGNLLAWDGRAFVNKGPAPRGSVPGSITFIDQRGNQQSVMVGAGSDFIPSLNNTLEGYFNRIPYEPDKKTAEEELSAAVLEARAKIARLEAERNSLDDGMVLDADAFIRGLGKEDVSDARLQRQKLAEEAQKKRLAAAKEAQEKKAKADEAARIAKVQSINDNLAKTVDDISVNQTRFKLDSQYVKSYVESGLGGTIDPNAIQSWSYEYSPAGQKLIMNYTDEHAASIGLPAGFNTQEFARARLIDLNVVPRQYGPSFTPIFQSGGSPTWNANAVGRSTGVTAPMATSGVVSSRGFPRKNPVYRRSIRNKSFIGANRVLPKNSARFISHQARQRGLTARTIPAKNGYRVYLGPKRL